jgi:hypothetical protein
MGNPQIIFLVGVGLLVLAVVLAARWETEEAAKFAGLTGMFVVFLFGGLSLAIFHHQPDGLYLVERVALPAFGSGAEMKLTIVSGEDFGRRDYHWPVREIKGFNYRCTVDKQPCGCIMVDDRFWSGEPVAKVVDCPPGLFRDWAQEKPAVTKAGKPPAAATPPKPEVESTPPSL